MSAVFLYVSGSGELERRDVVEAQLPFVPESSVKLKVPGGALYVWSVVDETAGGSWHHEGADGTLVCDGWVEGAATTQAVSAALAREGAAGLIAARGGQFSMVRVDQAGEVVALCDFLSARHVYWGQRGERVVIANRAMVAGAALDGAGPSVEPLKLSWMMCSIACMFGGETAWRGVQMLGAGEVLRARGGRVEVTPARGMEPEAAPWEAHWEALVGRVRQVAARADALPTRVAVTGGKDSRVVLAGLVGAGALDRVQTAYLRTKEGHQDELVGSELCAHYGLSFERIELPDPHAEPVASLLDRHNHQGEHMLHAWDLKGASVRAAEVGIHGHFGECLRSHMLPRFVLGWPEVRRKYLAPGYLDLYDVMTPQALSYVREGMVRWLEARRAEGVRPLALHDRLHREARMYRWASQCLISDGAGGLMASPLLSPALLRHYKALPLLEQRRHRLHFELIRRADDWLWRQRFAEASWTLGVAGWRAKLPAAQPSTGKPGRQLELWRAQGEALCALVEAPGGGDFHALFARDKVRALLERTRRDPSGHNVRAVLGLAGLRRTLDGVQASERFVIAR